MNYHICGISAHTETAGEMIQRLYAHAPIVEAVIDIRTTFQGGPSQERFRKFASALTQQLPVQTPMKVLEFGFQANDNQVRTDQSQVDMGFRLAREDGSRVLQVTEAGFAYSHLPPYSDWSTFRREALELWGTYKTECVPKSVGRVATRYVNKVNIPERGFDLSKYFNLSPGVPSAVGEDLTGYFMQVQVPLKQISAGAQSIVNFGISRSDALDHVTVLLDFDLSLQTSLDIRSDEVWELLDAFRDKKNEMFEACITDATRRLIDET
jgi:uncharacterized protein (TIGR04255 family)